MIETKEKIHLIWTQDTANLTLEIEGILRNNLWSLDYDVDKVLSSEINIYDEFADEETTIGELRDSVRGKHVWMISDINGKKWVPPHHIKYNDRLVQSLLLGNAAKIHGSKTLNIIASGVPYVREDKFPDGWVKSTTKRVSASADLFHTIILNELSPDYYVTMHVHNPAIFKGKNTTKCLDLYTWWSVQQALSQLSRDKNNVLLCSTDGWWQKKVEAIASDLDLNSMIVLKRRIKKNEVDEVTLTGSVEGKNVLLHDDMIDTAGSFVKLIDEMWRPNSPWGNPSTVDAVITAWLFNGLAKDKLKKLHDEWKIGTIFVTNLVYRDKYLSFVKVLDAAPNFAEVIEAVFTDRSIDFNKWADHNSTK